MLGVRAVEGHLRRWTLLGFSSGGGFVLRVVAEVPVGTAFDRYVLVSPYLKYNARSLRTAERSSDRKAGPAQITGKSRAAASTGRIIGLSILSFFGDASANLELVRGAPAHIATASAGAPLDHRASEDQDRAFGRA